MHRRDGAGRLENRGLNPQCGFASTVDGNIISVDEQWKKLSLMADVAQRLWSE